MAISEKGVKAAKDLKPKSDTPTLEKITKFFSENMTDEEIIKTAKDVFGSAFENMSLEFLKKNIKNNPKKKGEGLKEGRSTKKVKAKDGSRTKVRGTGAATKGFRKARLS